MDGTDADMIDSDTAAAREPPAPPELPSISDQIESVRRLLTLARQLIDQGKPSQALQAVVTAMRTRGGNEAAVQVLGRAQELYRNKIQESSASDQLASLFAECAIAEAMPSVSESSPSNMAAQSFEPDTHGTPILSETGRKQIMVDAFSDGSSFICLQCGGLVSNHRRDEHYAFWCCYS